MRRRNYVVAYDISDDKRRTKVFRVLLGYGDHAQFSVFLCQLNGQELVQMRHRLRGLINNAEDQIMIVELGLSVRPLDLSLDVLGIGYDPSVRVVVV